MTWSQGDIPGIKPQVTVHKLLTDLDHSLVRQKKRKFALEHLKVIEEEMAKLVKANIIRESHYLYWLANVVIVSKKGRSREYVLTLRPR